MYNADKARQQSFNRIKRIWFKSPIFIVMLYHYIVYKIVLYRILLKIIYTSIFKGEFEVAIYAKEYYYYGHIIPLLFRKTSVYYINDKTVYDIRNELAFKRGFKVDIKPRSFYKDIYMVVYWS